MVIIGTTIYKTCFEVFRSLLEKKSDKKVWFGPSPSLGHLPNFQNFLVEPFQKNYVTIN